MPSHYNPDEFSQLHKTVSKSFAMQRKTLVRVLGLEKKVSELESQQAAEEQAQEGIDEILDEIYGDKPKKKPAKKKRPAKPVGKKIPKKKPVAKKKKISAESLKKGTSLEPSQWFIEETARREKKKADAERHARNAHESAEGDERRKTSVYQEDVHGDTSPGEHLSGAERKKRFKLRKKGIKVEDIKKGTSVQGAENVAPNNEVTDLAKRQAAGDLPQGVTEPPAQDAQQSQLDGIKGPLKAIAESIDRIKDSLTGQSKVQEDAIEDARKSDEEKDAKKKESGLEKLMGPVKAAGEKILAPVKSLFGQIWDFFQTIFLGRIAYKLFDWFSNPANTDKIKSIFNFLADWWPVLVAGLMAIVGPGVIFAVGLVALLAWGIPKIINAVKSVFGFGKDIDKEIKTGEAGLKKDMKNVGGDATDSLEKDSGMPGKETPAEVSNLQKSSQDVQNQNVQNLNKGGEVQGRGDKDTVPAMLTPGEFVMSKGAVEQYGINTMEGMNAAAGGTNIPTMQKGKGDGKGMNLNVPRFSGGGTAAGVVTDPKERQQQEAYMLHWVNKEREFQGLPPLNNLTYAPGVELTKMIGPGPRTKEISDTNMDFDRGIKTTTTSKTVDGKTTIGGSISRTTEEDKQKFFAANPHAAQLVKIKDQVELDNLGADISASAKMNGGGLVPAFAGGGLIGRLKNAGANVLGKAKAQISKLQKPRVDHIHPPQTDDGGSKAAAAQVAQSSGDAATASGDPAPGIPNFDAAMMRSQSKIRTLGVSV